jgi:hypothetical protein
MKKQPDSLKQVSVVLDVFQRELVIPFRFHLCSQIHFLVWGPRGTTSSPCSL